MLTFANSFSVKNKLKKVKIRISKEGFMPVPKYPKEVDKYINDYLMIPYKIKILEVENNYYKSIHGRNNTKILNKIKLMENKMQMIEQNIDHKHFKHIDLLFRYPREDVGEKLNITDDHITRIRREIKEQFYNLMMQEGLI